MQVVHFQSFEHNKRQAVELAPTHSTAREHTSHDGAHAKQLGVTQNSHVRCLGCPKVKRHKEGKAAKKTKGKKGKIDMRRAISTQKEACERFVSVILTQTSSRRAICACRMCVQLDLEGGPIASGRRGGDSHGRNAKDRE